MPSAQLETPRLQIRNPSGFYTISDHPGTTNGSYQHFQLLSAVHSPVDIPTFPGPFYDIRSADTHRQLPDTVSEYFVDVDADYHPYSLLRVGDNTTNFRDYLKVFPAEEDVRALHRSFQNTSSAVDKLNRRKNRTHPNPARSTHNEDRLPSRLQKALPYWLIPLDTAEPIDCMLGGLTILRLDKSISVYSGMKDFMYEPEEIQDPPKDQYILRLPGFLPPESNGREVDMKYRLKIVVNEDVDASLLRATFRNAVSVGAGEIEYEISDMRRLVNVICEPEDRRE